MVHLRSVGTLALLSAAAALPATKRWAAPVVDLGYASYQGVYNETTNIQSFQGIRYAAPPTGNLRWRAPQPPAATQGLQDASKYGSQCIQGTVGGSPLDGLLERTAAALSISSEDCLFLNVYLPPNATVGQGSRPVVVWIHGGGYTIGSGTFTPNNLYAQPNSDFIFVAINYRLAQFGFLGGNEVAAAGGLNAGLLDQQFALKWVQDNIAKFGGDPGHVTIWGESAGAGSVMHQIIANGGNTQPSLFNAGILNSPFEPPIYWYNASKPQQAYNNLVAAANCTAAGDTLSCLRRADAKLLDFAAVLDTSQQVVGDFYYTPVIDGTFIEDRPEALLAQGKVNGERIWTTHNFNEGRVIYNGAFTPQNIGNDATLQRDWVSAFYPTLDNSFLDAIQAAYNAETFGDLQLATDEIYGEGVFGCEALWMSEAFSGNSYLGWVVIPGFDFHGSDLFLSFLSNTLAGTPYAPVAAQWVQNLNSFITSYTLESNYAATSFVSDAPQQVVVNVTTSLASDIAYDPVPSDFVARCNLWRSLAPSIPL